jgi:SeqA protein N-terminal domain
MGNNVYAAAGVSQELAISKTIRLDDDVLAYIAEYGKFGESHSDVLRRLLPNFPTRQRPDRAKSSNGRKSHARLPRGLARPAKDFVPIVAFVLFSRFNGKAMWQEVLNEIKKTFGGRFNSYDLASHGDGDIRWEENVKFAISLMRKEDKGLIVPADGSRDGMWELTRRGLEYAKGLGGDPSQIE